MIDDLNSPLIPPETWQQFEELCCDLFGEKLSLSEIKRYGRQGQSQNGVDIIGKETESDNWIGIQCKQKGVYPEKGITKAEIHSEVEKAKSFRPNLSKYIILTTAPRDAITQTYVMELSDLNEKISLFNIEIYFWDDIRLLLSKFPEVVKRNYLSAKNSDIIDKLNSTIESEFDTNFSRISTEMNTQLSSITPELIEPILSNEHKEVLASIKKELENNRPNTALRFLKSFKDRVWLTAPDHTKYQILTYEGKAYLKLHEFSKSGRKMIEALQYNSDDEDAIGNASIGYFLLDEFGDGKKLADEIIDKNPASSRGYSLLIYANGQSEDIEEIINKIPRYLQQTYDVAVAFGQHFYRWGNFEKAAYWLNIAKNEDKNNYPDFKVLFASAKFHQVTKDPKLLGGLQLTEHHKNLLNEAIQIYEEVLSEISDNHELRELIINLSIEMSEAKQLLGFLVKASEDIDRAYYIDKKNYRILFLKGWYAFQEKRYESALIFFEQIIFIDSFFPSPLELYLEAFRRLEKYNEGIEEIKEFKKSELTQDQKEILARSYIIFNISLGEEYYRKAENFAFKRYNDDCTDIDRLLDLIRTLKDIKKTEVAQSYVDEIKNLFSESLTIAKKLLIADIYYDFNRYADAILIYENIIDPELNVNFTPKLISAYYSIGNRKKALELCKIFHSKQGLLLYTVEIELAIYREVGDLAEAKLLCENYLSKFQDDYGMKLNLALVDLRIGNISSVDLFLAQPYEFESLSYDQGSKLVQLFYLRGCFSEALDLAYLLLKKFFDLPEAHRDYINICLYVLSKIPEPQCVDLQTTVKVEDKFGKVRYFTISKRNEGRKLDSDLYSDENLAKLLLGKKKDSKIILSEDKITGSGEYFIITGIYNKHVYTFWEIASSFNQNFPDYKGGPWRIPMRIEDEGGINPEDIKTLTTLTSKRIEWLNNILEIYKRNPVSIEILSNHLGTNILSVWSFITKEPELEIWFSYKTGVESLEILSNHETSTLIIDPVALLTINFLNIGVPLTKRYKKIGVTQSTVDLIEQAIVEYTDLKDQTRSRLTIINGNLAISELSAELIKEEHEMLKSILSWLKNNCIVIPCYPILDIAPDKKQEYNSLIGTASIDSVLLSTKPDYILYSDDRVIHFLADQEFNVDRKISTIDILKDCFNDGVIKNEQYIDLILSLISRHYNPITINSKLLYEAVEKANWELKSPYTDALNKIKKSINPEELISLAPGLEFIRSLWANKFIETDKRTIIFIKYLTETIPRDYRDNFIFLIKISIAHSPNLSPYDKEDILENIELWELIYAKNILEYTLENIDVHKKLDEF